MTALNLGSWSLIFAKIQNRLHKKNCPEAPYYLQYMYDPGFERLLSCPYSSSHFAMWSLQVTASWPIRHVCLFVLLLIFDLSKRQTKSVVYANL